MMAGRTVSLIALLAALTFIAACSAARMAPHKAGPIGGGTSPPSKPHVESTKKTTATDPHRDRATRRTEDEKHSPGPVPPPDNVTADAPVPDSADRGVALSSKEDDSAFEGDIFEEDAREAIDELVEEIEDGLDGYREEFGVEGLASSTPDSCEEICDLSEAICKSARRICAISGDHPQETYFADRCQWSTKQCARAGEQCNTCNR